MQWIVASLILVAFFGPAVASETPVTTRFEEPEATRAYEQAILYFNSHVKKFPSWEAFKAEVSSKVPEGTPGRCYELTGESMKPVVATSVSFSSLEGDGWYETSGHGWRHRKADRTFVEYRLNEEAAMLMRLEGVKPWFFFASAKRICQFPL